MNGEVRRDEINVGLVLGFVRVVDYHDSKVDVLDYDRSA